MEYITDIEIERLLKQNEKVLLDYLGKNKKKVRDYLNTLSQKNKLSALNDLISLAKIHKKTDPSN